MDSGVTGIVKGAGRVIGGLDPQELEEMSGFWRVGRGGRLRGRFFGGSFRPLLDGGVVKLSVNRSLLSMLVSLSSSTKTSSSSSTDEGVSLAPRPLSPPLEFRPLLLSSSFVSHHLE
jgi:hypothetical protein